MIEFWIHKDLTIFNCSGEDCFFLSVWWMKMKWLQWHNSKSQLSSLSSSLSVPQIIAYGLLQNLGRLDCSGKCLFELSILFMRWRVKQACKQYVWMCACIIFVIIGALAYFRTNKNLLMILVAALWFGKILHRFNFRIEKWIK